MNQVNLTHLRALVAIPTSRTVLSIDVRLVRNEPFLRH